MKSLPIVPDPATPHSSESSSTGSDPRTNFTVDPITTLKLKPHIVEALSTVYDPEIPVNIYELGLIYEIGVDAASVARITMTLTAPGCPAAQSLPLEVETKVRAVPGVSDAKVDVVWDPPWDRDKMSEVAKLQLGLF